MGHLETVDSGLMCITQRPTCTKKKQQQQPCSQEKKHCIVLNNVDACKTCSKLYNIVSWSTGRGKKSFSIVIDKYTFTILVPKWKFVKTCAI